MNLPQDLKHDRQVLEATAHGTLALTRSRRLIVDVRR